MGIVEWFQDISSGTWTALAAWVAVLLGVAALIYAWRQYRRARQESAELMQPNVAMFMEPSPSDWHLVELVVKNFGQTPAFGIRFEFANPPTVGKYESTYDHQGDHFVDIVPLNLPAEIPYLAPSQEWRIVWDSALDRRELGETIASRFDGAVTYFTEPSKNAGGKGGDRRRQLRSTAVLDWATLHPVERLELLTTHDLARQEKQKLELLRNLLTYFHYAANESREEVLRAEINRVRAAGEEVRERYRSQYNGPAASSAPVAPSAPVARPSAPVASPAQFAPPPPPPPPADPPPAEDEFAVSEWSPQPDPHDDAGFDPDGFEGPSFDADYDDAETTIINGRHRAM